MAAKLDYFRLLDTAKFVWSTLYFIKIMKLFRKLKNVCLKGQVFVEF